MQLDNYARNWQTRYAIRNRTYAHTGTATGSLRAEEEPKLANPNTRKTQSFHSISAALGACFAGPATQCTKKVNLHVVMCTGEV